MTTNVRPTRPNAAWLAPKIIVALLLTLWPVATTFAQDVTTGSLTGTVRDAQGGVLPGAAVTAVHTPTGARYEGITQTDGRFSLLNVRVGGPYELTIDLSGFAMVKMGNIRVSLGEGTEIPPVTMQVALTESVQVTAELSPLFTGSKTGSTDTVTSAMIETLPTINRSIQDFARTSPSFVQYSFNADSPALSIAGRNTRYNNIQIDGAVNNDLFSIGASGGTPGGAVETQPISIDVIQELQLVVAPYDVRQGSFSGGGINAITRSGSNQVTGSGFYLFRDQRLVGDGIDQ